VGCLSPGQMNFGSQATGAEMMLLNAFTNRRAFPMYLSFSGL
jgi:hypothetical protein